LIAELIHSLAKYERMSDMCEITPEAITLHLFGPNPAAEALIAEYDGAPEGFALFFTTFSTFLGKPGLYLEDLFVKPDSRGLGIGKALLLHLVTLAQERNCGRVEWAVLNWNESAIGFYKKLGAKPMNEWAVYRLTEESISDLTWMTDHPAPLRREARGR
jgi:GNAT superfamily N-acetyltransferase